MQRSNRELWLAFIAVVLITAVYLFMLVTLEKVPQASGFFGHAISILGFVLMLMTEILYTLRKRSRSARWGRMAEWLNFHIFTGIVGPYMVLLHSSWKFNGLAGILTLLTAIIVASGFIGRYIYTSVPRTADGVEIEAGLLQTQITAVKNELQHQAKEQPEIAGLLAGKLIPASSTGTGTAALLMPRSPGWWSRLQWRLEKRRFSAATRSQVDHFEDLIRRQETLRRQVASLAMARRLLALWHAIHIPIGMALFTAAFIHIIAAVYYATLLR